MGEFALDGVAMSGADALLSFAPTAPPASEGDEFGRALSRATESARPERQSDLQRPTEQSTSSPSPQRLTLRSSSLQTKIFFLLIIRLLLKLEES